MCSQILILLYIYPHLLLYLNETDRYKFHLVFHMSRNTSPNLRRSRKVFGICVLRFLRTLFPPYTCIIFSQASILVWRVGWHEKSQGKNVFRKLSWVLFSPFFSAFFTVPYFSGETGHCLVDERILMYLRNFAYMQIRALVCEKKTLPFSSEI